METGKINQRIQIFENNNQPDGYGGVTQDINDVPYWDTNAQIKFLSSSRNLEANQTQLKPVVNFKVRYRNDKFLKDNMLVKWRGAYFIIQGYIPQVVYQEYISFDAIEYQQNDIVTNRNDGVYTAYFGMVNSLEPLTSLDDLIEIKLNKKGKIVIPYSFDYFGIPILALPNDIPVPTMYENLNSPIDKGDVGHLNDFLGVPYELNGYNVMQGSYMVKVTDNLYFY